MGRYTHYFESQSAFTEARSNNYIEPWLSYTEGKGVDYNKSENEKLIGQQLTLEIISGGTFEFLSGEEAEYHLEYKLNNNDWPEYQQSFSVNSGDIIQLRGVGDLAGYFSQEYRIDNSRIRITDGGKAYMYGNAMSLLYGINKVGNEYVASDDFITATTIGDYQFVNLFLIVNNETPRLYSHPTKDIILPATTLGVACYAAMFKNQSNMTRAPKLPATTLSNACYGGFLYFDGFLNGGMFEGCTNLNYIECMATDVYSSACTKNWVKGVQTNNGTFVGNPSTLWKTGQYYYNGIPFNWRNNISNVETLNYFAVSGDSGYDTDITITMPDKTGGTFDVYYDTNETNFDYTLTYSGASYIYENYASAVTINIDRQNNKFIFTIPDFSSSYEAYSTFEIELIFRISGSSENNISIKFTYYSEEESEKFVFSDTQTSAITVNYNDANENGSSLEWTLSYDANVAQEVNNESISCTLISGDTNSYFDNAISNVSFDMDTSNSEITIAMNLDNILDGIDNDGDGQSTTPIIQCDIEFTNYDENEGDDIYYNLVAYIVLDV